LHDLLLTLKEGSGIFLPEDRRLHNHCCENLRPYNTNLVVSYNLVEKLDVLLSPFIKLRNLDLVYKTINMKKEIMKRNFANNFHQHAFPSHVTRAKCSDTFVT
jgi:hypothetical protein